MKMKKMAIALALCLAMGTTTLHAAENAVTDLSADVLEYDTESGVMHAVGSVKMIRDNAVMTGAEARYNSKTQEGLVTGGVVVTKDDLTMHAAQVQSMGNTHLIATGDVVATKGERVLTGPVVEYFSDREYAIIPSNAKVTMPDGTITADRMEAFMKENHIIGQGNVHIVSETRNLDATGDKADYYGEQKGKVILSGNAVAVQENNTLRGNTLTLYLAGEKKNAD